MKKLKTFEMFEITDDEIVGDKWKKYVPENNKFNIGDHVIVTDKLELPDKDCSNFLNNNVGQISYYEGQDNKNWYDVKYDNIPLNLENDMQSVLHKDDVFGVYSFVESELRLATPEEIEMQLIKNDTDKYNL